jgi:hypothetical protein
MPISQSAYDLGLHDGSVDGHLRVPIADTEKPQTVLPISPAAAVPPDSVLNQSRQVTPMESGGFFSRKLGEMPKGS